jgi:hypothetical protein
VGRLRFIFFFLSRGLIRSIAPQGPFATHAAAMLCERAARRFSLKGAPGGHDLHRVSCQAPRGVGRFLLWVRRTSRYDSLTFGIAKELSASGRSKLNEGCHAFTAQRGRHGVYADACSPGSAVRAWHPRFTPDTIRTVQFASMRELGAATRGFPRWRFGLVCRRQHSTFGGRYKKQNWSPLVGGVGQ